MARSGSRYFFISFMISLAVFSLFNGKGAHAAGFWRVDCGVIQTGRVDPIINPGAVSGHVHQVSGGYNFNLNSSYKDMINSKCTSCGIMADKSAYWTPLLYYQHPNGTFQDVHNGGTLVYYLARGTNTSAIQPFPPGFKMVSGSSTARSFDHNTLTWDGSTPISNRVSFVCLDAKNQYPQTPGLNHTSCSDGLRAQIDFQSCWDGVNLYKSDNSHVAYLSRIDNGECPSSHPILFMHLFFEMYYTVNAITQSDGGRFVFANGDPTGYGFHGDFLNGWDPSVLQAAITQCGIGDNPSGEVVTCSPLKAVDSQYYTQNCPQRPALVNETTNGLLKALPGCNQVTFGPAAANTSQVSCPPGTPQPATNHFVESTADQAPQLPVINSIIGGWQYIGSANEPSNGRALAAANWNDPSMTPEICQQFCSSKNFPFAGVEYGDECYCDFQLNKGSTLSTNYSTVYNSLVCAGNSTQFCGGPGELLLYNNTHYQPPFPFVAGVTLGPAKYVGCASEVNGRALRGASTTSNNMTIQLCASFCSGYALFGLEYATQCYCDNALQTGSALGDTQCTMTCGGNGSQICGGPNALTLFKNTAFQPPVQAPTTTTPGSSTIFKSVSVASASVHTLVANVTTLISNAGFNFTYGGCANEYTGSPGRALQGAGYVGNNVTNEACANYCASFNFLYAGTEYGDECYCGNSFKPGSTLTVSTCQGLMACASSLPATSNFAAYPNTCGKGNVLTVWINNRYKPVQSPPVVNTSTTPPKEYLSLGCYTEALSSRALSSASTTSSSMTNELCVNYCAAHGYSLAGTEFSSQCYCSNSLSSGSVLAPNQGDCNMLCSGNRVEYCGGPNRLNIYQAAKTGRVRRRDVR